MRKIVLVVLLLCSVAAPAGASSTVARNITEKDLFKFTWIADPQLSPDGMQVAFVRVTVDEKGDKYATSIWTVAAQSNATPRQITNGTRDTTPRWSPDGRTLAFLRVADKEAQIYLLPMSGGEPRALTSMPKSVESIAWSPDGKRIAFTATTKPSDFDKKKEKNDEHESDVRVINQAAYRANGAGYPDPMRNTHVWVIDVADDAKPKALTSGEFDEENATWSPDGARIYFTSTRVRETYYDARYDDIYYVPSNGGDMVKLTDSKSSAGRIAPSPDGKWIAYTGSLAQPVLSYTQPDLFIVSTSGGASRNLTEKFDNDVMSGIGGDQRAPRGSKASPVVWSNDSKTLLIETAEQGRGNLVRVDAATGAMKPWTSGNHDIQNFDVAANGRTIVLLSTPTIIGDLYLVGDGGALSRITNVNQKLFSEVTITEPEEIWYTSFDGRKIEAWAQKPPDFDPSKKYPLILNIHGGPHSAYGYTFDHEFQWMAAKGYVVLYPNPRGSTTYGQDFGNIIQYKYPGDDYKDLMAGVDALIAKGWIDPKKLGVTGGSGGGVLTNWTITQTDRFAAAVSQRSIADWAGFWYVADFTLFEPTWFRKAPWEDPADFKQRSAITYIDRVKTPLMLIEGEADYRTPPMTGGEMMFRALKYQHKPVVMVRFPDESHELSRSGKPWHRIERLEHIVAWFDKWLMGAKIDTYDAGLRE